MNLIERVKNILITPQKEWDVINGEQPNTEAIITNYVLPLAGAAAVAAFIGYAFIDIDVVFLKVKGINGGLYQGITEGITVLVAALLSVFICAFVIDMLAPTFDSEKNMGRSVQLVAYSWTPAWIGGLLAILPSLSIVGSLAGLYGLYLLYVGLPKLKKTPQDKYVGYFVMSLLVMIVVFIVIGLIIGAILMAVFGLFYGTSDIYYI
jgi:hypothetical protein